MKDHDYKKLLIEYMRLIILREGITYLNFDHDIKNLSDDEIQELKNVSNEVS